MSAVGLDYSLGQRFPTENRELLRHALRHASGHAVEFGVGDGLSLNIIAEHMPVTGFDAFRGLPEDWRPGYPKGVFATNPPPVGPNANLVIGWFADTLPVFDFAALAPIALVHFDADLYSSTKTALEHIGPHLQAGTVVVFDEFHGYPGAEQHEERAWREFTEGVDIGWAVLGSSDESWAIQITEGT